MAYIIVRGSEKQGGFVSMVKKERVAGVVRTTSYVCGLGRMTMTEFKAYQKWAHSLKPQEYRKQMVLSSGRAITEKEQAPVRIAAAKAQRKTTVKQAPKKTGRTPKRTVRKHFPVPKLMGYKEEGKIKTHTEMMREKEIEKQKVRAVVMKKEKYMSLSPTERNERIKELEIKKRFWRKEWRHWDLIISEGGLYSSKKERAERASCEYYMGAMDKEIKRLKEWRR